MRIKTTSLRYNLVTFLLSAFGDRENPKELKAFGFYTILICGGTMYAMWATLMIAVGIGGFVLFNTLLILTGSGFCTVSFHLRHIKEEGGVWNFRIRSGVVQMARRIHSALHKQVEFY